MLGSRLWAVARPGKRCFSSAASAPVRARDLLANRLEQGLREAKAAGTYKTERVILSPQASSIVVGSDRRPALNFCANNYLGLSSHPRVIKAAHDALSSHGFGMSSVRFICGTQDIHKRLEGKIAAFHGMADAILYGSAFDANGGLFEALLGEQDAVISDALNHASIIDGIRLCKAHRYRYVHLDMADLEAKLQEARQAVGATNLVLIATDGAFSMDGQVAPLPDICRLADKYNALIFMDECHATGFLGATGRGTDEYHNVRGRIDIINSTLGKAMGGASGGYTAASQAIVDTLRQKSRPYLFSNTVAPPVVAASEAAFDIVMASSELRNALVANTARFRARMAQAGFVLKGTDHPICPVMLGDARLASAMAADMLDRHGIYVIGFSYPVVPKGEARIRVQLSAEHTLEQVDRAVDAFIETGKRHGVVK